MLWLKNELAQLILWADHWGYKEVSPCIMCQSLCQKEKLCVFFESGDNYSPTLFNTVKYIYKRIKNWWEEIDGKMFKVSVIIYIVVVGGYLISIILDRF